eukprot:g12889.t1
MLTHSPEAAEAYIEEAGIGDKREIAQARDILKGTYFYHEDLKLQPGYQKQVRRKPGFGEGGGAVFGEDGVVKKRRLFMEPPRVKTGIRELGKYKLPAGWEFRTDQKGGNGTFVLHEKSSKSGKNSASGLEGNRRLATTKAAYDFFYELLKRQKAEAEAWIAVNKWGEAPEVRLAYKILAGTEKTFKEYEAEKAERRN